MRRNAAILMIFVFLSAAPAALAQVSLDLGGANGGAVRPGYAGTCDGSARGAIRYSSGSGVLAYCDGTSWIAVGGSGGTCPGADVASGLIAHWRLDESSGTSVADSSGNGLTGTLTPGAAGWFPAAGTYGGMREFDGSATRIVVNDPGTNSIIDRASGTSMTITAWVDKPTPADGGVIVTRDTGAGTGGAGRHNYEFILGEESLQSEQGFATGNLYFTFTDSSGNFQVFGGPNVPGGWHFIGFTATFGTTGTAAFYLDGLRHTAIPLLGSPHTTAPATNNNPLWIGAGRWSSASSVDGAFSRPANPGYLDDIRIYNRALSAAEMRQVYRYTHQDCN